MRNVIRIVALAGSLLAAGLAGGKPSAPKKPAVEGGKPSAPKRPADEGDAH